MNLAINQTVTISEDLNHPRAGKIGKVVYIGPPIIHVEFDDGATNTFAADELRQVKPGEIAS